MAIIMIGSTPAAPLAQLKDPSPEERDQMVSVWACLFQELDQMDLLGVELDPFAKMSCRASANSSGISFR